MPQVTTTLPHLVSEAFSDSTNIWFPEAAPRLVEFVWEDAKQKNFSPENYGTHRWLQNDPTRERFQLSRFKLSDDSEFSIEVLPTSSRRRYEKTGLAFSHQCSVDAFPSALGVIRCVPSLYATISLYLRSLHLLQAPTDNHDVSHSDPAVPFSIFVSVPPPDARGRIRLAESIVHECMHLQLSIMEKIVPLFDESGAMHFSPWQQTRRPISGLLHGLYVFSVIHSFLGMAVLSESLSNDERHYVISRRRKISDEVASMSSQCWSDSLSSVGRDLGRRLLQNIHLRS